MRLKRRGAVLSLGFPELCAAALMIGAGKGKTLLIAVLSALAHECGHFIMMKLCGAHTERMTFSVAGADIRPDSRALSYRKDILIAAAGPAVSAFAAAGLFFFHKVLGSETAVRAALTNAVLAAVNLLPVPPLDGYRIVRAAMMRRETPDTEKRLRSAGVFTAAVLIVSCAAVSAAWGFQPSLTVFTFFILLELYHGSAF